MPRQRNRRPVVAARGSTVRKRLSTQGIAVSRPREVNAYLRQHPDLAELVPAVCADVRREFGSSTELALDVYDDPEVEDSYLTLYVRPPTYEADLLDRIHRVSDTHAEDLARTSGHFLVTTDFRAAVAPHGV